MFKWFKNLMQDMKISWNFMSYDEKCRKKHLELAEKRFSTDELKQQLDLLMHPILLEKESRFDLPTNKLRSSIAETNRAISGCQEKLVLFKRNYKEELDYKYSERKTIFEERDKLFPGRDHLENKIKAAYVEKNEAYNEKKEAYGDLEDAQLDVSSWHSKSKRSTWIGGNKGKKLPQHSMFGQSHGDLSGYKRDHDNAYDEVQSAKSRIQEINTQIQRLKEQKKTINDNIRNLNERAHGIKQHINKIKEDRQRMFDLKDQGYIRRKLEEEIGQQEKGLNQMEYKLMKLKTECDEFMVKSKSKAGVIDLEKNIRTVLENKKVFIKDFDSENAINLRKQEHREAWIAERCKP